MGKLTEKVAKLVKAEVEETVSLPTPEEIAAKFAADEQAKLEAIKAEEEKEAAISPIIKMAIEQAEARRIKDLYHGFK